MKANAFVKEFGWTAAKKMIDGLKVEYHINGIKTSPTIVLDDGATWISYDDLKRLVESWELVQVGLPELKRSMFSDSKDLDYVKNWLLNVSEKLLTDKGVKLKQAIADVESCQ